MDEKFNSFDRETQPLNSQNTEFTPPQNTAFTPPQNTTPSPYDQNTGSGYTVTSQGGYFSFTPPATQPQPQPQPPVEPIPMPVAKDYSGYAAPLPPREKPKKESKGVSMITVVIAALLAALIGAGSAVAVVFAAFNPSSRNSQSEQRPNMSNSSVASGSGNTVNIDVEDVDATVVEAVAKKVTPSVVGIRTIGAIDSFFGSSEETLGEGSGVIYTEDGYIITNYHVISYAVEYDDSKIQVFLSDDKESGYEASVIGYNISCDLAVIKIDAENLPAVTIAKSSDLNVGQFVVAIGNPGGLEFMGSVTYGVISGLNRIVSDAEESQNVELIQTDAAINPGNSGGALVNIEGELVGINSSKIAAVDYEAMGFAIPSDTVVSICQRIIDKKDSPTPYIGVSINTRYDAATLEYYGYPKGAVVYSVAEDSPAEKAGLQKNDIITEFNGTTITGYSILLDTIALCEPGDTVSITVYREGREYKGTITVGSNNSK